jgi:hypothetical protein
MNDATDGTPVSSQPVTCVKKKRFDNEERAWSAIFNMRARGQDTERLAPYRCVHCDRWHLGRQPARVSALAAYRAGIRA